MSAQGKSRLQAGFAATSPDWMMGHRVRMLVDALPFFAGGDRGAAGIGAFLQGDDVRGVGE